MSKSKYWPYYEGFKKSNERITYIRKTAEATGFSEAMMKKIFYEWLQKDQKEGDIKVEEELVEEDPEIRLGAHIEFDKKFKKAQDEAIGHRNKYKKLLEENEILEKRLDAALGLVDQNYSDSVIEIGSHGGDHEATPIILLSDWHFEETVDPSTVNGLNEYNLDIADKRWVKCIQNSLWLIRNDRKHSTIKNLVLWLGGDFITGYIHEEMREINSLSPTQALMFAKEKLVTAIQFYIDHGDFENIEIICNFGNHGRTTQKLLVHAGYRNSYEWMMYHDLKKYFGSRGYENVRFSIPNGFFAYVKTYGFMNRFFHGDALKYNGGIGGLTVPLIKALHRANEQIFADYTYLGHFHTRFNATRNCLVNGSGIGFNAYSQRMLLSPESPVQSYVLIDSRRGQTIMAPIFCS